MRQEFNPFVAQRREMKLQLLKIIRTHPAMEKKQMMALFSLQTGLKKQRIEEYWIELEEAGVIEDGGWDRAKGSAERNSERAQPNDVRNNVDVATGEGTGSASDQSKDEDAGDEAVGDEQKDGETDK